MSADARMRDGGADFKPLFEMALGVEAFASNWAHCDKIATYVARLVSHNRTDSLLYANLFSSALNELLETAFRAHRGGGELACHVSRSGPVDRIELTIPCDEVLRGFYTRAIEELSGDDVSERYVAALEKPSYPLAGIEWHRPARGTVKADLAPGQVLSLQICHHPGWHATVNGEPRRIFSFGFFNKSRFFQFSI